MDNRSSNEFAFISTRDYSGRIYHGTKAIADLTLRVVDGSGVVEDVFVNDRRFDRFSGLHEVAAGATLTVAGFPTLSAPFDRARRADPECQATFLFDPRGKPMNPTRRLFGTIKTSMGQVMTFDVKGSNEAPMVKGFTGQELLIPERGTGRSPLEFGSPRR